MSPVCSFGELINRSNVEFLFTLSRRNKEIEKKQKKKINKKKKKKTRMKRRLRLIEIHL